MKKVSDRIYLCYDNVGCEQRAEQKKAAERLAERLSVTLRWTEHWWNIHREDHVVSGKTVAELNYWLAGYQDGLTDGKDK